MGPIAQAAPARGPAEIAQQPAPSPAAIEAEVSFIHATNDGDGGIDPNIGKLPNLGSYKNYRLLQRAKVSIRRVRPHDHAPNGDPPKSR
jgi:hypothetical protein